MMTMVLAAIPVLMKLLAVLWFITAIVLMLVILMQKGRGGGLSAAFAGGAQNLLGSKTGDFFTWLTICLVGGFLLLSIVLAMWFKPAEEKWLNMPKPAAAQTTQAPAGKKTDSPASGSEGKPVDNVPEAQTGLEPEKALEDLQSPAEANKPGN